MSDESTAVLQGQLERAVAGDAEAGNDFWS